jgi:sec-independent protein translocase protein TatA
MEGLFQPMHLIVILAIALIIFGPRRLPELGEGLGKSIKAFKNAINEKDEPKEATRFISQGDEKSGFIY